MQIDTKINTKTIGSGVATGEGCGGLQLPPLNLK